MCRLDKKSVFNLADFTLSTNGIIKGDKIINELKKIVPDMNIEDLPISYTAIAADIKNKKKLFLKKGAFMKPFVRQYQSRVFLSLISWMRWF